jgi:hypothetical protein
VNMMPNQWAKAVENELLALRNRYPSDRPDETQWAGRLKAYLEDLRPFASEIVGRACRRAKEPEFYPDRFPSSGQLVRVCREMARPNAIEATKARATTEDPRQLADPRVVYADVPSTLDGQHDWIEAGESAGEGLAREWIAESCNLRIDPNRPTPPDVFRRRMDQLNRLLGEIPSAKENRISP